MVFFFKQKTAYEMRISDWSSDVCSSDLLRLGGIGHGGVGVIPVALDAETLEILALHVDPVFGELAALEAELEDRHGILVLHGHAVFLLHLPFAVHALAAPPGDIVRGRPPNRLRAVDTVLLDLVPPVALHEIM